MGESLAWLGVELVTGTGVGLSHTDIDVLVAHPKGFPDPEEVMPRIPSWKT